MQVKHFSNRILAYSCVMLALLAALITSPIGGSFGKVQAQTEKSQPKSVVVAGTFQKQLGCADDWKPECDKTALTYNEKNDLWSAEFDLAAGDYEFKAALNGTWDLNYGAGAKMGGDNIKMSLAQQTKVKFFFDNNTGYISNNAISILANVPGSYQDTIGCPGQWQPDCLRSLLEDPDGDGVYTFTTNKIPKGAYEAKVAVNESWGENYGAKGAKDGPNVGFNVPFADLTVQFTWDSKTKIMAIDVVGAPKGNIQGASAQWLTRDTIAWASEAVKPDSVVTLTYDPAGAITLEKAGIAGGTSVPLTLDQAGLSDELKVKFPYLSDAKIYKVPADVIAKLPEILKGQVVISAVNADKQLLDATTPQIPGVLDELYSYNGALGVTFSDGIPSISVWAPTAQNVALNLYDDASQTSQAKEIAMTADPATGVWTVTGDASWVGKYYAFVVNVFVRTTGKIERNVVTDPYSVTLSANSQRSQIVDLNDPKLQPKDWAAVQKPALAAFEDIVVYELHLRDFSINDQTVPEALRGTYMAFTVKDSNGMKHLKELADAGLTHLHLLPVFDIASVTEKRADQKTPNQEKLAGYPADSDKQQDYLSEFINRDGYNWGYDPYHYNAPEGSYSTDPDGSQRVIEFREMVKAINESGLRVVMDVVYNHTTASGQNNKSVLDKIVPGYYYRLNMDGNVEKSTCCENTATEHKMMEKLMVDSVVQWAKAYKVDGFRFDLMGHHMVSNMLAVRSALDALTLEKDGIDGKKVYLYGEGWDFGEVAKNARGINASQLNLGGTGIGSFNDRLRDAVRGGGPFSDPQVQGFATGLLSDPNAKETRTTDDQKKQLLTYADWIKVGLAGNLKNFPLTNAAGNQVLGSQVDYNGSPTGYTLDPQENIIYVSAHDNETLWDKIQFAAAAGDTVKDRIRMSNLAVSVTMLAQGVPFFHAGDDMLRSKSGDKNSYNAGDWFNKLDFTYESNNWAVGLPPAGDNKDRYPILQPLLANADLKVAKDDILFSIAHFEEMLKIRKSSPLFRLETADQVYSKLSFLNNGPDQTPGVIVMVLDDTGKEDLDPNYSKIVVVFKRTNTAQTVTDPSFKGTSFALHPVQAESADPVVKTSAFDASAGSFSIPARTTAVFVAK